MAKVKAFQCMRTGLYFPGDYYEEWGRKYGKGLGSTVVSEALVNDYTQKPVIKPNGDKVYPVANCKAQVIPVMVEQSEYDAKKAILMEGDEGYQLRMPALESRQVANKKVERSVK